MILNCDQVGTVQRLLGLASCDKIRKMRTKEPRNMVQTASLYVDRWFFNRFLYEAKNAYIWENECLSLDRCIVVKFYVEYASGDLAAWCSIPNIRRFTGLPLVKTALFYVKGLILEKKQFRNWGEAKNVKVNICGKASTGKTSDTHSSTTRCFAM